MDLRTKMRQWVVLVALVALAACQGNDDPSAGESDAGEERADEATEADIQDDPSADEDD
jgi:ABC-type enterochelin transport system substrate-binding protein